MANSNLISLESLFSTEIQPPIWILEGILIQGGLSILAGRPKAGKSTFARAMALAISRGENFLEKKTMGGSVVYFALEEHLGRLKESFQNLGATGLEPIHIVESLNPKQNQGILREAIAATGAQLAIIDPLFKFIQVKDSNDYATVYSALAPILSIARETNCHVLTVHHLGKGERRGAEGVLGSTALTAAVDTTIMLNRDGQQRYLSTQQRYGDDLEETTLNFDPVNSQYSLGSVIQKDRTETERERIMDALRFMPMDLSELQATLKIKREFLVKTVEDLISNGLLLKSGSGQKGNPFRYSIAAQFD